MIEKNVKSEIKKYGENISKIDSRRFSLYTEIKKHPLYKISNKDKKARALLEEYKGKEKILKSKQYIVPGQLVLFKYLNPKTLEELEYYDASPCTLFFGTFNSSEGKRVLGFNLHYFPPQLRYIIADKIYTMFKPVYSKYFDTGSTKAFEGFNYKYIVDELEKQNLSFAVRMYIPSLIGETFVIPPKMWTTALMTEGWFKKETRAAIMKYFKTDSKKKKKNTTGSHDKGKKYRKSHNKK